MSEKLTFAQQVKLLLEDVREILDIMESEAELLDAAQRRLQLEKLSKRIAAE
jgi:hypothetical protein